MKLYNLFFGTFFMFFNFSIGVADIDEFKHRDFVNSSYNNDQRLLKSNKLKYLAKDLDQIYEKLYEIITEFRDYFEEHQDLTDRLKSVSNETTACMENGLNDAMNHYKDSVKKLSETLEETPKNPTCYEDLVPFFEDIKESLRTSLADDEIYIKIKDVIIEEKEDFNKLDMNTMKFPNEIKIIFKTTIRTYINMMIELLSDNDKKNDILLQSKAAVEIIKISFNRLLEFHKQNVKRGMLNKGGLLNIIKKYEGYHSTCQYNRDKLYSAVATMQSFISTNITTIEKYASAKFYIIDDDNSKKQLDCDDHVPYFGTRPTENVISVTMNDGNATFYLTGTDKDGRNYTREYTSYDINDKETTVNEKIEYDDKILDRKYVVKFA